MEQSHVLIAAQSQMLFDAWRGNGSKGIQIISQRRHEKKRKNKFNVGGS